MNDTRFDTRSSEMRGDLALWAQLHGDTNSEQLSRLLRQLRQAREQELTPRQREFLLLYYDQQLSMRAIAQQHGVHVSTVSRTLQRGRERLRHVLLPDCGLAFVTDDGRFAPKASRTIRVDAMLPAEGLRQVRAKVRLLAKVEGELLDEAVEHIAAAHALHDRMEELYRPHVDFGALEQFCRQEADRLK